MRSCVGSSFREFRRHFGVLTLQCGAKVQGCRSCFAGRLPGDAIGEGAVAPFRRLRGVVLLPGRLSNPSQASRVPVVTCNGAEVKGGD